MKPGLFGVFIVPMLVPITLFGWVAVVLLLFTMLPARRAVLVSFLGAWLFLPVAAIGLPGLPDYTKTAAASVSVMMAVCLFDSGRLFSYRFSWVDLPMIVWCLAPFGSSMTNGLGPYDGLSAVTSQIFTWGIPWLLGRLYFNTPEAMKELALTVLVGGLIYVPLCLWEIRMSPNLHRIVYGHHPTHFMMTKRFGGYRPMVFMQHGLMLGLWMASATLMAIWLWSTKSVQQFKSVPMWMLVGALGVTTVLCKSTGALALLAGGVLFLYANRITKMSLGVWALVAMAPLYMVVRATNVWGGEQMIAVAEGIDEDRAKSLAGRLRNEDLIIDKALRKPAFGWGGWKRWRVRDETGKDITVSDGLWVITMGRNGLTGVGAWTLSMLLPVVLLLRRARPAQWSHPALAPMAAGAVILVLYVLDCLLNAMLNPMYVLIAGGLTGVYVMGRGVIEQACQPHLLQMVAAGRVPEAWSMPAPATPSAYQRRAAIRAQQRAFQKFATDTGGTEDNESTELPGASP